MSKYLSVLFKCEDILTLYDDVISLGNIVSIIRNSYYFIRSYWVLHATPNSKGEGEKSVYFVAICFTIGIATFIDLRVDIQTYL